MLNDDAGLETLPADMTTMSTPESAATRGWSERWSPLGGLVFALAVIVVLVFANVDAGETPQDVISAADDEGGKLGTQLALALVSIPLVLWFVVGLYVRVRRFPSQTAPALVLAGGTAFAILFFLAFTIWSAPLLDFPGKADPTASANAYLTIDDVGWVALGGAGVAFALMAAAASIAALRARAVPTWLGWASLIVGVAAAATITFVGLFAWIAWILVASVLLLVRRA
jgi:hypothetical protein